MPRSNVQISVVPVEVVAAERTTALPISPEEVKEVLKPVKSKKKKVSGEERIDRYTLAPWKEFFEAGTGRIIARCQARDRLLAIRASEPEWSKLCALGLPPRPERRQPTLLIPLPLLPEAMQILGTEALEWIRAECPAWRTLVAQEREIHKQRKLNEPLLQQITASRTPAEIEAVLNPAQVDLFATVVHDDRASTARFPKDHPFHRLYPFQQAGVILAILSEHRMILADDMGLGKTVQALVDLDLLPEAKRVLIVAPSVVSWNWADEAQIWAPTLQVDVAKSKVAIEKWVKEEMKGSKEEGSKPAKEQEASQGQDAGQILDPLILSPPAPSSLPSKAKKKALVVTWTLLDLALDALLQVPWTSIVADEDHAAKEMTSRRTQALLAVGIGARHRLALTGTPMLNRPVELWPLLFFIDPVRFCRWKPFAERFGGPRDQQIAGRTIRTYKGASHLPELNQLLRPFLVRRIKEDVLTDLPEQRERTIWLEEDPSLPAYEPIIEAMKASEGVSPVEAGRALAAFVGLRRQTALAKIPAAVEWILRALGAGDPLVVFFTHKDMHQALEAGLEAAGIRTASIVGGVAPKKRQTIKNAFQAGEIPVLLGSEAMSDGVTLHRANQSLHLEPWYTPAKRSQAQDRIYRIGQTHAVLHTKLLLKRSLDVYFEKMNDRKEGWIEATIERA